MGTEHTVIENLDDKITMDNNGKSLTITLADDELIENLKSFQRWALRDGKRSDEQKYSLSKDDSGTGVIISGYILAALQDLKGTYITDAKERELRLKLAEIDRLSKLQGKTAHMLLHRNNRPTLKPRASLIANAPARKPQ